MDEWKADDKFLNFLLARLKDEGSDLDVPFMGASNNAHSLRKIVEEMRKGKHQKLYERLYSIYQKEFGSHKTIS